MEETNELLRIMVEGANCGWRDKNGSFSKSTVEKKMLPVLNAKLGTQTTYKEYVSRVKWFKGRYTNYSQLMRFNSEFGWDPIAKKFTASDEVWEDYFKAHPTHRSYRTDIFTNYEYLEITIGNRTATGSHAIGLGEETDARTIEIKDNKVSGLDDLTYDPHTETFIQSDTHDTLPHSSSTSDFTSHPMNSEVLPTTRKRNRMDIEGKSSLFEPNSCQFDVLNNIAQNIGELKQTIDSIESREVSCWDIMKEIPNLNQRARFKALKLLNTRAKRMDFLKMTPEERSDWIYFLLEE
ncbi:hypothetical protein FNV43_RR27147 [Rhamnella rubrinervis]|uniref:Myb/SANT-like domain-containing protein n=1 Tax=Rhamnella rubrinervis TaxID=2594499 RepID=A0A8K0DJV4_9ROSA|nr:hypothetical protein FNV43_RR27147 [Rhamnella rubrinervis]